MARQQLQEISAIRLELLKELAGLPEALRSGFPDLGVDFLASALADGRSRPVPRATHSGTDHASEQAESSSQAAETPVLPPLPVGDPATASRLLEEVQREACEIDATALTRLPPSCLPPGRPPDGKGGGGGGARQLLACARCRKVLYAAAAAAHEAVCVQAPLMQASSVSISSDTRPAASGGGGGGGSSAGGSKRRRSDDMSGAEGAKLTQMMRASRRASSPSSENEEAEVAGATQPPLPPVELTSQQRRPRALQPPRFRRREFQSLLEHLK